MAGREKLASCAAILLAICVSATTGLGQAQPEGGTSTQQQPDASQNPERVHVARGVTTGLLIKRVNPEYPEKARRKRIQGTVVLHALIGKEGDIVDLTTVSGDPLLAKAAIKAVKQWKYRPYLFQGKPVDVDTEIQVNFTLSGG